MANWLDYTRELELQSRYYVDFRINTFTEVMKSFIPRDMR